MRPFSLRSLALASILLFLGSLVAFGQEATIVGTVTDPSGAAVPNVSVTITDTDTTLASHFTTNEAGEYVAPHLQIGHYQLRAQGSGFKVVDQKGIVLQNGDRRRVDIQLQVGSTQETVVVEATPIAVQSDSNDISTVITGTQITQLQTNGRSLYELVNLTPGATSMQGDFSAPTSMGADGAVSFNGNREAHDLYMIDNAETEDRGGSGSIVMPSLDSLSEFRIQTSNYSAEYGLTSGATISSVVKSGTKQLHASAWWFGRNDDLDARNYVNPRENANGTLNPVAELRYNLWGFNVGGPVEFKHSDNPKTFFFYNMEWRRLIQGSLPSNRTVPFTSEYGGDLSAAIAAGNLFNTGGLHTPCSNKISTTVANNFAAAGVPLSTCDASGNVITAGNFPGNVIPSSLLDPNAQALLHAGGPFGGIFPGPTTGDTFTASTSAPTSVKEEIARIDHTFSDKWSIYGHWISDQAMQTDIPARWSGANVPTSSDTFGNPSYSAVIHAVNTIRPNLLNEIAFNYDGNRINMLPSALWNISGTKYQQNKLFSFKTDVLPIVNLGGKTGAQFNNNWNPWINTADDYQIRDDVSWTRGTHQFKFGGSWANFRKAQPLQTSPEGNFSFNGTFTGYDFADFLLGLSNQYSESALEDTRHWNSVSWAAYFQDDWRATRRLTLNLGLRWDGIPHTAEINGQMANWYPNLWNATGAATAFAPGSGVGFANSNGSQICSGAGIPTATCTGANPFLATGPNPALNGLLMYDNGLGVPGKTPGVNNSLVNNSWDTFGPRIGFAYDVTGRGRTILRAGFGTFFERIQGNDMYQAAGSENLFNANTSINNVSLSDPHIGVDQTNAVISTSTLPVTVNNQTALNASRYKIPTEYQYSVGLQQQFSAETVFSVAYVANQGRFESYTQNVDVPVQSALPSLLTGVQYNTILPYPGYRNLVIYQDGENSHYNSLQMQIRSRLHAGLQLQAGYTLSRAIDPSQNNGDGGDLDGVTNPYAGWQYDVGPATTDRTSVFFANFVYDLPIFQKSSNRFTKDVLGGWQLSGIITAESGAPITPTYSGTSICNTVQNCSVRPNQVASVSYPRSEVTNPNSGQQVLRWFNPSAFAPAFVTGSTSVATWGNAPFDGVRGPGRQEWNLAMFKTFAASERLHFELRAEAFNVWNHTQFQNVDTSINDSTAGMTTSAFDPREFQLGAKVIF
jgi:Carboxypeptidase regulatory-like domain